MSVVEIALAMYFKEKESLDQEVAADIDVWVGKCNLDGLSRSGAFINGVWEREEARARRLSRFYSETVIELSIKQKRMLELDDIEQIRGTSQEIIDAELSQAKKSTFDWIKKSGIGLESLFDQKHEEAKRSYREALERELKIRTGLAGIEGVKRIAAEIPSSAIIKKDFAFVSDDDLRRICERDYEEVQRVQIAGAHKATIVLSGSLTEALLLDTLGKDEPKTKASSKAPSRPLTQWGLHNLLEVAIDLTLINPGAAALVKGIQDYRNLIHPGKEVRTKFTVGPEEAAISRQFLDLVIRDLSGRP